jgi:hypothetical protein
MLVCLLYPSTTPFFETLYPPALGITPAVLSLTVANHVGLSTVCYPLDYIPAKSREKMSGGCHKKCPLLRFLTKISIIFKSFMKNKIKQIL